VNVKFRKEWWKVKTEKSLHLIKNIMSSKATTAYKQCRQLEANKLFKLKKLKIINY